MLRPEAIELMYELSTTTDLLTSATHINLQAYPDNQTRLIFHSMLDFEQRELLRHLVKEKNFKLVECTNNVYIIY